MTDTLIETTIDELFDSLAALDDLWAVIVWNDDVNTFEHVIHSLILIFGHTSERSEQLAWRVHHEGKAVVGVRPRDEAIAAAGELHLRKIQASVERA